jgi:type VI secretion system secreted protein Hcp
MADNTVKGHDPRSSPDQFLKIDGIAGESRVTGHGGEIDVLGWSWGVTQSGTMHQGGGGGGGKVSVQDLKITKLIDKSTPNLIQACCSGRHIGDAFLTLRKAGGDSLEYFKMTLHNVIITSVSTESSSESIIPKENVTLNFAAVEICYTPQTNRGQGGGSVSAGWDVARNAAL